jgi:hypothetical protein
MMLSCVLWTPVLRAQQTSEPVLALIVAPDIVPVEALSAALTSELGVAISTAESARGTIPTISVTRLASGNVEVALSSRSLPRASRELVLTGTAEEQNETVALIAANLVRNEAAALLPDLRPAPSALVSAAPKVPEKPKLVSPCDVRADEPFGVDLVPGVGSSSSRHGRAATRHVSLGWLGTYSRGLHGVELSVGVNIKRASVCGVQAAPGANIALGPVSGVQFASFNLAGGPLVGAQFGTANIVGNNLRGAQFGVLAVAAGAVVGAQFGVANYAGGGVRGLQAGVLNVDIGRSEGFQGGVINFAGGGASGFQGGVVNVGVGDRYGFQGGVVNVNAGETRALQLGAINVSTGKVQGAQIGVINYADESSASIGLMSIVRRGRTSFDALYSFESGITLFGVTHGGKYVHNVYGIGFRDGRKDNGQRLALMYGLGVRVLSTERFRFDLDALAVRLLRHDAYDDNTVIPTVRAPLTFMVFRALGVTVAPSYQVMITDDPEESTQSIWGESVLKRGKRRVFGYPGLLLGVRWQFDHGV